jgi:hypothetical protein
MSAKKSQEMSEAIQRKWPYKLQKVKLQGWDYPSSLEITSGHHKLQIPVMELQDLTFALLSFNLTLV